MSGKLSNKHTSGKRPAIIARGAQHHGGGFRDNQCIPQGSANIPHRNIDGSFSRSEMFGGTLSNLIGTPSGLIFAAGALFLVYYLVLK